MADDLKNIICANGNFTEMFPLLTSTSQTANNVLSEDPSGPVKPYLQLDGIHGTALMKSTTYMAFHFHVALTTVSRHV